MVKWEIFIVIIKIIIIIIIIFIIKMKVKMINKNNNENDNENDKKTSEIKKTQHDTEICFLNYSNCFIRSGKVFCKV